ncbi:MAG: hypothetical protein ACWA5A_02195 [Marinibacterium sp.]
MTLITAESVPQEGEGTADLLKALQESIADLRKTALALKRQIEAGETGDLAGSTREIQSAEQLARHCMKTEVALAEICNRKAGIVRGGYALDLDAARSEIGCRLGRLRQCRGT